MKSYDDGVSRGRHLSLTHQALLRVLIKIYIKKFRRDSTDMYAEGFLLGLSGLA